MTIKTTGSTLANAFTAPRRPAFTDAERRAMRKSEASSRGGMAGYTSQRGALYTTINPRPKPQQPQQ